jgi:hypothetical protein
MRPVRLNWAPLSSPVGLCLRYAPANKPGPPMIGELENRVHPVPTTFSFRGSLDIRRRLPDRMVKESAP